MNAHRMLGRAGVGLLALLMADPAAAAVDGARLYGRHCAACHGADGNGGVGVPLALPSFLGSVPDDYLRKSIRLGRPGRVMPAFRSLRDTEVEAIVAHIRAWSPRPVADFAAATVHGDATRGAALYAKHCAACHGGNGEGGHGNGVTMSRPRDLPILAPALNNAGFLAAATDQMIRATLINGRAGTPMGSFLKQGLSETDIDDVVAFVRAFERTPPAAHSAAVDSPVIVRTSPYSFEQTVQNLKNAVIGVNFRLIRLQYLDEGFVPEGKENKKQVMVYSCNFNFLNDALKVDPRVGMFLPCRITVVEQGGKVLVMAVNPKRLSTIFNNRELDQMCEQMHKIYVDMIEETVM